MDQTPRAQFQTRWGELTTERSSWITHWREISENVLPRNGRFLVTDRNRGEKKHNSIYDSTATRSLRILAAGMMSGMTSPARPWFRLRTNDADLMEFQPVKVWAEQVQKLMLDIFQRSNTYRTLHHIYEELGAFGTAASIVVPDYDAVIWHHPLTIGEYAIDTDWSGRVVTLYREFDTTVARLVKEFGFDKCSSQVQSMHKAGALGKWVTVIHAIEPRSDRDPGNPSARHMPWRSVYFEKGGNEGQVLRDSGFARFPALAPRWTVAGGDIYGNSPGMDALGDVKQLQHEQLRKAWAIDYMTNPPLQAPFSLKNRDTAILPGGLTYVDAVGPDHGIRSIWDVRLDLGHLLADIQDVRERIKGGFFADLFLLMSQDNGTLTATEVTVRNEEKLLMLGPVLERLHNELLSPLIELTFDRIIEANLLPPPPQELQGVDLNVELVSMLAQAQRAVGTNSIDRFVVNLGSVAQVDPDVLDCFDSDEWAAIYADSLGIDARLLRAPDQVQMIRQGRAQQAQQAQQIAQMEQAAGAAQKLAAAPTGSAPNALTDITQAFSGYT